MDRFNKLKPERSKPTCYLCGKKREIVTSNSNLIAPTIGAFRWQFSDEDTNKDIALTWTFSDTDGKIVSLCWDCSGYVLGSAAKAYCDGEMNHIVAPLEDED